MSMHASSLQTTVSFVMNDSVHCKADTLHMKIQLKCMQIPQLELQLDPLESGSWPSLEEVAENCHALIITVALWKPSMVRHHLCDSCPSRTKSTAEKLLCFKHLFTSIMFISLTGSGKTNFAMHLIDSVNAMIEPTQNKIDYYFAKYQPLFDHYSDVDFHHGMPKVDEVEKNHRPARGAQ